MDHHSPVSSMLINEELHLLRNRVKELEINLEKASRYNFTEAQEKTSLRSRAEKAEQSFEALVRTSVKMELENEKLSRAIQENDEKYKALERKYDALKVKYDTLKQQNKDFKQNLSDKTIEMEKLSRTAKEKSMEVKALKAQLRQKLESDSNLQTSFTTTLALKEDELQNLRKGLAEKVELLGVTKSQTSLLEKDLASIKEELESTKIAMNLEIDKLKDELHKKNAELNQAKLYETELKSTLESETIKSKTLEHDLMLMKSNDPSIIIEVEMYDGTIKEITCHNENCYSSILKFGEEYALRDEISQALHRHVLRELER